MSDIGNKVEKTTDKKATVAKPEKKGNFLKKPFRFLKDVKSEAKKIVWPNKKQIMNNTGVVLVVMALASIIIWPLDFLLQRLFTLMF